MDPYVVPFYFHLGLGIGAIGPAFSTSLVIFGTLYHLFELLLNRERKKENEFDWPSF